MANNKALTQAARAKKDEFYTQLSDIENELRHYKKFLAGKVVFCNCDDPYESEFFRYFAMQFNMIGLKRLIATSYGTSPVAGTERTPADHNGQLSLFPPDEAEPARRVPAYKFIVNSSPPRPDGGFLGRNEADRLATVAGNELSFLRGDGDFRSPECVELLKQADAVITNPPFSLFREYVAQLVEYGKKFLIIGSVNAITYKEIFSLIMRNQIWLGAHFGKLNFRVPANYEERSAGWVDEAGQKWRSMGNVCWLTNIDTDASCRHETLPLWRHYHDDPSPFPKYENYDAIEVSKVSDIPDDYDGVMGVPITFLDKYNPEQFEIIGMCENLNLYGLKTRVYSSQECRERYFQLFGKKGTYDLNAAGVVNGKKVYQRILIKRKGHGYGG